MNLYSHLKKQKSLKIISEDCKFIDVPKLDKIVVDNNNILSNFGIKKNDVIGIVLENGIDFITTFLSVINKSIAAPLNPNYSIREFDFYYTDLKPKIIITNFNKDHAALKCARKKKIRILNIKNFVLYAKGNLGKKPSNKYPKPTLSDTALILHTSGTTSRPKMVPLSHRNLLKSAYNISVSLKLRKKDKNIILMPSFHIHGIVASIIAPLFKGAQVVALPKFNVLNFYNYLSIHNPTWFTAVPTMLQSIVDRSKNNKKIIKLNKLRFIRSSSASLPSNTLKEVENIFKVPVIESYGMTEASHQMTTNLLPPYKRKIGSVGVAVGLEVKIVNSNFDRLKPYEVGEIVIKGNNVISKYLANKEININSFHKNWFKTGDLGYLDSDNCLFITGRIKEIINRGGEKISPKEVDDIFIKHSKVAKAISFAIEHPKLGEDIALAIVLKENKQCVASELKDFAKNKIASFKIPKKIYFLKSIPLGATGKIQRIGLAKKLGIEK